MLLTIRAAQVSDQAALRELYRELHPGDPLSFRGGRHRTVARRAATCRNHDFACRSRRCLCQHLHARHLPQFLQGRASFCADRKCRDPSRPPPVRLRSGRCSTRNRARARTGMLPGEPDDGISQGGNAALLCGHGPKKGSKDGLRGKIYLTVSSALRPLFLCPRVTRLKMTGRMAQDRDWWLASDLSGRARYGKDSRASCTRGVCLPRVRRHAVVVQAVPQDERS